MPALPIAASSLAKPSSGCLGWHSEEGTTGLLRLGYPPATRLVSNVMLAGSKPNPWNNGFDLTSASKGPQGLGSQRFVSPDYTSLDG